MSVLETLHMLTIYTQMGMIRIRLLVMTIPVMRSDGRRNFVELERLKALV